MHTGVPLFWAVTLQRMAVDRGAVQRAAGMEQIMGGHVALARMFEDPDIAAPFGAGRAIFVCERCAGEQTSVYQLGLPEGDDGAGGK